MNYTCFPIIVLCSYFIGEIFKVVFKKKEDLYKLIPILVSIFGGLLGVVIYKVTPTIMFDCDNLWCALGVGIVSGASSTGCNQIIKQLNKDSGDEDDS